MKRTLQSSFLLAGWLSLAAASATKPKVEELEGDWVESTAGNTEFALRVDKISPEGQVEGIACSEFSDGSLWGFDFGWGAGEYGVTKSTKFQTLTIRRAGFVYTFSPRLVEQIPIVGVRVRRRENRAGWKATMRPATAPTCLDHMVSRYDAASIPAKRSEQQPLLGDWRGEWANGVTGEIQIRSINEEGEVAGTYCEANDGNSLWVLRMEPGWMNARARREKRTMIEWTREASPDAMPRGGRFTIDLDGEVMRFTVKPRGERPGHLRLRRGVVVRGCMGRVVRAPVETKLARTRRLEAERGAEPSGK